MNPPGQEPIAAAGESAEHGQTKIVMGGEAAQKAKSLGMVTDRKSPTSGRFLIVHNSRSTGAPKF
jgi:hypothetical protein